MACDICLSVVVPVYNVEQYLARCLDSLIHVQGMENNEMILIDDGSTDRSGEICDSYAERYGFIRCIHKENSGLSDARNTGLMNASGKYVFFCDSDDMVSPEGFGKAVRLLAEKDIDVLLWDGLSVDENDLQISREVDLMLDHSGISTNGEVINGTDALIGPVAHHGRQVISACLMACRREFLLEKGILFEGGILHEDELWTPIVLTLASRVIYLPEKIYLYRQRQGSIMGASSDDQKKHAEDFIYVMNSLYDYYRTHVQDRKKLRILLGNWAATYLWAIREYEVYKYECSYQISGKELFGAAAGIKDRIKGLFILIFGVRAYCVLRKRSN